MEPIRTHGRKKKQSIIIKVILIIAILAAFFIAFKQVLTAAGWIGGGNSLTDDYTYVRVVSQQPISVEFYAGGLPYITTPIYPQVYQIPRGKLFQVTCESSKFTYMFTADGEKVQVDANQLPAEAATLIGNTKITAYWKEVSAC